MVRYTGEDMDKMQQEAVRRMQEMQIRGRGGRASPPVPEKKENTVSSSVPEKTSVTEIQVSQSQNSSSEKNSGFLDMLFQDKEKSLILLLILILSSEKNDTGLLFALAYLLI